MVRPLTLWGLGFRVLGFGVFGLLGNACYMSMPAYAQEAVPASEVVSASELGDSKPDLINTLHQREWVSLSAEGALEGTVNAFNFDGELKGRSAVVVSLMRDGKEVAQTKSDAEGKFRFSGVVTGTYALVVKGDSVFSTYALHVLANGEHLNSELSVYAATLNESRAKALVAEFWVPTNESTLNYYRSHNQDPLASTRKFNDSHRVQLQGSDLVGRVSRPGWSYSDQDLSGSVAQILKDGKVVRTAAVSKDGYFKVADMEPGVYDLFVGGDDGVAIVGFQAIAAREMPVSSDLENPLVVSTQGEVSNTLCCELVQPIDVAPPVVQQDPIAMDPGMPIVDPGFGPPVMGGGFGAPAGGGFGGGGGGLGGGGGGFGGGVGGLGGLLGIAGLAVGVAALGDDDDFTPPVATVIAP